MALAVGHAINDGVSEICGAITRKGGRCQNRLGADCPYHSDEQRARAAASPPPGAPDPKRGRMRSAAVAARDLHGVAWALLEGLLADDTVDAARKASAGATLIRVVDGLGEPPVDTVEALVVRFQALARDLELGLKPRLLLLAGAIELAAADLAGALDALFLGQCLGALLVEALLYIGDDGLVLEGAGGGVGPLGLQA